MSSRQLTKSTTNKMVSGTIAGVGEYFGWSRDIITFVRILYVVLAFTSWGGLVVLYIVASCIIPSGRHSSNRYDRYQNYQEDRRERWEDKARRYNDKWSSGDKSGGGWSNPWDNPTNASGRKRKEVEPLDKEDDWSDF